jgi:hypothetical protein
MHKPVVYPAQYVRGALPSLFREPGLITEIVFALKITNWAEAKDLHDSAMQTYSAPTQTEPDEPIFGNVSAAMVKNFWEHADRFGWSRQQTRDYLRSYFQVESPKHLSLQDYNAMFKRLRAGPQTPVVH